MNPETFSQELGYSFKIMPSLFYIDYFILENMFHE